MDSIELARSVVNVLEDKKGEDIILLDISEISTFADYFVICSGTSNRMLKALVDAIKDEAKRNQELQMLVEGEPHDGWLLADLGDVIVHLFSTEQRSFYDLEELWSDGRILLRLH